MFAWAWAACFAVLAIGCSSAGPAPIVNNDPSDVAPVPTIEDIQILRRADTLLSDASKWNHFGDRECDPVAQSWNLYCVVHRASVDVTHRFEHRSAAMQEVRWVVDDRTRGIELQHRLMDYNNLPTTTFADIKAVLADAITRLEAKVDRHSEH